MVNISEGLGVTKNICLGVSGSHNLQFDKMPLILWFSGTQKPSSNGQWELDKSYGHPQAVVTLPKGQNELC